MWLKRALYLVCGVCLVVAALLALGCGGGGAPPPAAAYTYTDIGLAAGWTESVARDVNDAGKVVGWGSIFTQDVAFLWTTADGFTQLLPAGWTESRAYAINNSDQVAGWGVSPAGERAFVWDAINGFTEILPNGWTSSRAYDINAVGQVVGQGATTDFRTPGFVWREAAGAGPIELWRSDWSNIKPRAINDGGWVAGYCLTPSPEGPHAFLWVAGIAHGFTDVTALAGWEEMYAYDLSNDGKMVGRRETNGGAAPEGPAFVWDSGGGFTQIVFPGLPGAVAHGINEAGQVVGFGQFSAPSGIAGRGFVWTAADGLAEVGDPSWTYCEAYAINEAGQIVGRFFTATETHAYLATPNP